MSTPEQNDAIVEVSVTDLVRKVLSHRLFILRTTVVITLLALLGGIVQYLRQPERATVSLSFRLTFQGAPQGSYPNGLKFGVYDIVDPSITSQVFETNRLSEYCSLEVFQGGMTVG